MHAVSWSKDGRYLGVASTGDDGLGTTRVFEWPGMALGLKAATQGAGHYAAVADDGAVYWTAWDPFSTARPATTVWRQEIGGPPEQLGTVEDGRYLSLDWAAGFLVAVETATPGGSRLVRLSIAEPGAEPVALTGWQRVAGELWIDPTGEWILWQEPNQPIDHPEQLVVQHNGSDTRTLLPGYGGRVPTLLPGNTHAIYQRSETARLTIVDLASGEIRGELDDGEYYGGEVSVQGILAGVTAHGPWQTNDLCLLDVTRTLSELAG